MNELVLKSNELLERIANLLEDNNFLKSGLHYVLGVAQIDGVPATFDGELKIS